MKKVAVIGGGLSGLAAAYELSKHDVSVDLFEAENYLGGLASSFKIGDVWIPKCYHHISHFDTVTLDYFRELGLESKLEWRKLGTDFWFNSTPYRLSEPLDVLKFKPLSFSQRVRFAFGLLQCYLSDHANSEEDAATWLERRVGKVVKEKVFDKLSQIKYGNDLSNISSEWLARRMHVTARTREEYAYPVGGLEQFIDRFRCEIFEREGRLFICNATFFVNKNHYLELERNYNAVISTVPIAELDWMLNLKSGIDYCQVVSCVFGTEEKIVNNYWNVMVDPQYSFGGIFDHTMLCPSSHTSFSEHVYQMFTYADPYLYSSDEETIMQTYLCDLAKFGMKSKPNWYRVFTFPFAQPIFSMNYVNPPIKVNSKLYLAGVYREFPNTRTMNSALMSGRNTAMKVLSEL